MISTGTEPAPSSFGDVLRHWRQLRGKSQLTVASDAGTTPRYMSFLENGRARPSREMVVRLAGALDVPLRERNGMLLAAGFAPAYRAAPIDSPPIESVSNAVRMMLDHHEPYPAVLLDRTWNVLRANAGAADLFGRLVAPDALPEPANVLRLILAPGRVRDAVLNWDQVAPALLDRVHREAVEGVVDADTIQLLRELRRDRDVDDALGRRAAEAPAGPMIDLHFQLDIGVVRFFSVVSTIGTPIDITAQELRVEAFFPFDDATRERWLTRPAPSAAT
jgi:transcriptional regulator with XRE-family HTH domain